MKSGALPPPNTSGMAIAIIRLASMTARITSRTTVASGSSSLVSQVVKFHDHHTTASMSPAWPVPFHVRCSSRWCVICVIAKTNTRS